MMLWTLLIFQFFFYLMRNIKFLLFSLWDETEQKLTIARQRQHIVVRGTEEEEEEEEI